MNLVCYWNPAPIVRHVADEEADGVFRTLCGVTIREGWESGEDRLEEYGPGGLSVGCIKCSAALEKVRAQLAKEQTP